MGKKRIKNVKNFVNQNEAVTEKSKRRKNKEFLIFILIVFNFCP